MRRLRHLATLLIHPLAFAVQGGAVAHGLAHQHEGEHGRQQLRETAVQHVARAEAEEADHGHRHAHPDLGQPVRARADAGVFALPAAAPEIPVAGETLVASEPPIVRALLPRGDPSNGPPPRLRGPPPR
ncbi:MAG TPA: hypothetical protein VGD77_06545 [Gemmatimonadaceae bacterium]